MTCPHANTVSGQEWASEADCADTVTCLDCDAVIVRQPRGVVGSLTQQMEWLDEQ